MVRLDGEKEERRRQKDTGILRLTVELYDDSILAVERSGDTRLEMQRSN
jgi:hypothetical protein